MIFQSGAFERDMRDVIELCSRWWDESKFYESYQIPYNVDVEFFRNLHHAGVLIYTIGRDVESGRALSCYVGIKMPYMFNREISSASEVVWCVDKSVRSYRAAYALLDAIDGLMLSHNIELWSLAVSNTDIYKPLGNLLERRDYILMDKIFTKRRS